MGSRLLSVEIFLNGFDNFTTQHIWLKPTEMLPVCWSIPLVRKLMHVSLSPLSPGAAVSLSRSERYDPAAELPQNYSSLQPSLMRTASRFWLGCCPECLIETNTLQDPLKKTAIRGHIKSLSRCGEGCKQIRCIKTCNGVFWFSFFLLHE